jgi:hypothetical protein
MMDENKLIEDIKKLSAQIKMDDMEESPDLAFEQFQCECCGAMKVLAGSLLYSSYRLCNECVLLAELGFATEQLTDIQQLIDSMEDKRFDNIYTGLFGLDENSMN